MPKSIVQAVKRWCANNYMNRGDDVVGQNFPCVSEDKTYLRMINVIGRLYDMDFI